MKVASCILCDAATLAPVIDLGEHPLADTFLKKEELTEAEPRYPLIVQLCSTCGHAMLTGIVPPEERYQKHDYSYDSGNSKASIQHFCEMASDIVARVGVSSNDLVVDIGGSVGTLLAAFRAETSCRILNIEPAGNIAARAKEAGIPTIADFFGASAVEAIEKEGGAKVMTMTNAFNHIGNLQDFMQDIVRALRPDGAFVIEVPYHLRLVEQGAFDTIYLEHISYFALKPLRAFLRRYDLHITAVTETPYMGGSMRVFIRKEGEEAADLETRIKEEEAAGIFDTARYERFMADVQGLKKKLRHDITAAKESGGRIIGIGAATKGNTLLNYCGIDASMLEFVTDASPLKVGKYTPGTHIPILPDEAITDEITHGLILPWNIADLLTSKLAPRYPRLAFIVPHIGE